MALLIFVYAVSLVLVFGAEYASEWSRLPDTTTMSGRFAQVCASGADKGTGSARTARPTPPLSSDEVIAGGPPSPITPALRPRRPPAGPRAVKHGARWSHDAC